MKEYDFECFVDYWKYKIKIYKKRKYKYQRIAVIKKDMKEAWNEGQLAVSTLDNLEY